MAEQCLGADLGVCRSRVIYTVRTPSGGRLHFTSEAEALAAVEAAVATLPVLRTDVESIEAILREYVDCPEVWGDTINRLRALLGKPPTP